MRGTQASMATTSMAVLLICGVELAGCGAMGGPEEASKPKPELTTVAGDGGSHLGDGGPATEAGLCGPTDVALDVEGNMYIADTGDYCTGPGGNTVRKVDPDGTITTVAGTGEPGFSGDGGPATKAKLVSPFAVAVDREGNLYIADVFNYRIRKVDKDGIISTFAGTGRKGYSGDGGPATSAKLIDPGGMAFDAQGNLYISDGLIVRKIDPSGTITTFAGTGRKGYSGDGGPATEAKLGPNDVALDSQGNLYMSEYGNQRIRMVDKDGIIHTVAGTGKEGYSGDGGPATEAALNNPWGITLDGEGDLFFTDHHNSVVRKVDKEGKITTVAGTEEMLYDPIGLFFEEDSGVLYIADALNARIRAVRWEGGS